MTDTLGNVRLGRYGFDGDFRVVPAPVVGVVVVAGWLGLAAGTVAAAVAGSAVLASFLGVVALGVLAVTAAATHTTKRGKFQVWDELLRDLQLTGDERLVDLGCGRGAVLMAAAKRLPNGRAEGADIWAPDQTGNGADAAYRNAEREGVRDRVVLHTADITSLPFEDASVDVVVSSVAVHNIDTPAGRAAAIDEAARILRPGRPAVHRRRPLHRRVRHPPQGERLQRGATPQPGLALLVGRPLARDPPGVDPQAIAAPTAAAGRWGWHPWDPAAGLGCSRAPRNAVT